MARLIAIDKLTKGMMSDDHSVGTLREAIDVVPWRGALRRRGPIRTKASATYPNPTFSSVITNGSAAATGLAGTAGLVAGAYHGWASANGTDLTKTNISASDGIPFTRGIRVGKELLFLKWNKNDIVRYCGKNGAVYYDDTVTVSLTAGSSIATFSAPITASSITGAGYIEVGSEAYRVETAISSTQIQLSEKAHQTLTNVGWVAKSTVKLNVSNAPQGGALFRQYGRGQSGAPVFQNTAAVKAGCYHLGRLVLGNMTEVLSGESGQYTSRPGRIRWSSLPGDAPDSDYYTGIQNFNADAYIDIEGDGGEILGMHSFNGALVILQERAIQTITGSLATNGSDVGAQVNNVAEGIGVRNELAWEPFENGIAFADDNGCYVWDGSRVTNLTRGSVQLAWRRLFKNKASKIIVSCPGNRIVVMLDDGFQNVCNWLVYHMEHSCWTRMKTNRPYSKIVEYNGMHLAMRQQAFGSGASATVELFDFKSVWDDLGTDSASGSTDDSDTNNAYPAPYILTNPIPLSNGFENGRVKEVVLNDGGMFDNNTAAYAARLLRGPIYSGDSFSGDTGLVSQVLGTSTVPGFNSVSEVDQRSIKIVLDPIEATHAMVEVSVTPLANQVCAYALNAIGLVVEDNPNYEVA